MDEFLNDFLVECSENLSRIDSDLLQLEKDPGNSEIIKTIFRAIHTVKGSCGMFGFSRLEKVAHVTEDVLGKMRDGSLVPDPQSVNVVLRAIDVIKGMLAEIQATKKEAEGDDREIISALQAVLEGKAPAPKEVMSEPENKTVTPVQPQGNVTDNTLRVSVDVLDGLMNAIGELVLSRNRLIQLTHQHENSEFLAPIQHLNRVTSSLQEAVMKTRMQPIGNAWAKLPRIVRDLCHVSGKRIEVVMNGQGTEIDRQVLQAIQDPLIHCVRNSADHGIEMPSVRVEKGKPSQGTIFLDAFHEGGRIVIEIRDDGAGVNTNAVKNKAIERGIVTAEEAEKLSEREIINFIFEPGFSTAAQVTEVSGRGVGMDVVRSNIEKIGGSIDLSSVAGKGTTLRIEIPLTLAIIQALVVKPSRQRPDVFAIPQMAVSELVRINSDNRHLLEDIHGSRFLRLRDKLLPLIDLDHQLGGEKTPFGHLGEAECNVVIVNAGGENFGLCVHEILDMHEIVVKPLGKYLRDINLYAGCTILGDGRVVIILDINRLIQKSVRKSDRDAEMNAGESTEEITSGDLTSLILFRGKESAPKAVPLALVSRFEEIPAKQIEIMNGTYLYQYRGNLLKLIPCDHNLDIKGKEKLSAIIFSDGKRAMGLLVSEIIDIVETRIELEDCGQRPGVLGASVVNGQATEMVDTYHYLQTAYPDWFDHSSRGSSGESKRILYVEDSPFFRNLIRILLESKGYDVVTANNGEEALAVLDAGEEFSFILSDIEMPLMDGFTLAKRVRERSELRKIPLVALTTLNSEPEKKKGFESGFDDYLVKFDQDLLLTTIKERLHVQ